jgi:hypothetical protein
MSNLSSPCGFGIVAALAMTSVALAGGNGDGKNNIPTGNGEGPVPNQDGVTITAAAGKGITFAADTFKLNLVNRIQVNFGYTNNENAEDTLGVRVRRARTKLAGDAYKDTVHFVMQFEWADGQTNDITDALLLWDFYKTDSGTMSLRFGQGKTLFGTEATGTSAGLEFIDRARATMAFANIRSRQAQVVGSMDGGRLRWNAGLLNNDVSAASLGATGEDSNNASNELNWIAGASYGSGQDEVYGEGRKQGALKVADEPMWVANAAIAYGQNDQQDTGAEYDAFTINGGGAYWTGHLHFLGEVFIRDESADRAGSGIESQAFGWQAQGTYTMDPGQTIQWAYGARLSGVHVTDVSGTGPVIFNPGTGGEGDILEVQVVASAYYVGHNLKTQFGYTFQDVDPDVGTGSTNHVVELQSQVIF